MADDRFVRWVNEIVVRSFLDQRYDLNRTWHITKVDKFDDRFSKDFYNKKAELEQFGAEMANDHFFFTCQTLLKHVAIINNHGLHCYKGTKGVVLYRFADVILRFMETKSNLSRCWLILYKGMYGRTAVYDGNPLREPTQNFDCHVATWNPSFIDSNLNSQVQMSQVFMYETDPTRPTGYSSRPRQCLPYAFVELVCTLHPPAPQQSNYRLNNYSQLNIVQPAPEIGTNDQLFHLQHEHRQPDSLSCNRSNRHASAHVRRGANAAMGSQFPWNITVRDMLSSDYPDQNSLTSQSSYRTGSFNPNLPPTNVHNPRPPVHGRELNQNSAPRTQVHNAQQVYSSSLECTDAATASFSRRAAGHGLILPTSNVQSSPAAAVDLSRGASWCPARTVAPEPRLCAPLQGLSPSARQSFPTGQRTDHQPRCAPRCRMPLCSEQRGVSQARGLFPAEQQSDRQSHYVPVGSSLSDALSMAMAFRSAENNADITHAQRPPNLVQNSRMPCVRSATKHQNYRSVDGNSNARDVNGAAANGIITSLNSQTMPSEQRMHHQSQGLSPSAGLTFPADRRTDQLPFDAYEDGVISSRPPAYSELFPSDGDASLAWGNILRLQSENAANAALGGAFVRYAIIVKDVCRMLQTELATTRYVIESAVHKFGELPQSNVALSMFSGHLNGVLQKTSHINQYFMNFVADPSTDILDMNILDLHIDLVSRCKENLKRIFDDYLHRCNPSGDNSLAACGALMISEFLVHYDELLIYAELVNDSALSVVPKRCHVDLPSQIDPNEALRSNIDPRHHQHVIGEMLPDDHLSTLPDLDSYSHSLRYSGEFTSDQSSVDDTNHGNPVPVVIAPDGTDKDGTDVNSQPAIVKIEKKVRRRAMPDHLIILDADNQSLPMDRSDTDGLLTAVKTEPREQVQTDFVSTPSANNVPEGGGSTSDDVCIGPFADLAARHNFHLVALVNNDGVCVVKKLAAPCGGGGEVQVEPSDSPSESADKQNDGSLSSLIDSLISSMLISPHTRIQQDGSECPSVATSAASIANSVERAISDKSAVCDSAVRVECTARKETPDRPSESADNPNNSSLSALVDSLISENVTTAAACIASSVECMTGDKLTVSDSAVRVECTAGKGKPDGMSESADNPNKNPLSATADSLIPSGVTTEAACVTGSVGHVMGGELAASDSCLATVDGVNLVENVSSAEHKKDLGCSLDSTVAMVHVGENGDNRISIQLQQEFVDSKLAMLISNTESHTALELEQQPVSSKLFHDEAATPLVFDLTSCSPTATAHDLDCCPLISTACPEAACSADVCSGTAADTVIDVGISSSGPAVKSFDEVVAWHVPSTTREPDEWITSLVSQCYECIEITSSPESCINLDDEESEDESPGGFMKIENVCSILPTAFEDTNLKFSDSSEVLNQHHCSAFTDADDSPECPEDASEEEDVEPENDVSETCDVSSRNVQDVGKTGPDTQTDCEVVEIHNSSELNEAATVETPAGSDKRICTSGIKEHGGHTKLITDESKHHNKHKHSDKSCVSSYSSEQGTSQKSPHEQNCSSSSNKPHVLDKEERVSSHSSKHHSEPRIHSADRVKHHSVNHASRSVSRESEQARHHTKHKGGHHLSSGVNHSHHDKDESVKYNSKHKNSEHQSSEKACHSAVHEKCGEVHLRDSSKHRTKTHRHEPMKHKHRGSSPADVTKSALQDVEFCQQEDIGKHGSGVTVEDVQSCGTNKEYGMRISRKRGYSESHLEEEPKDSSLSSSDDKQGKVKLLKLTNIITEQTNLTSVQDVVHSGNILDTRSCTSVVGFVAVTSQQTHVIGSDQVVVKKKPKLVSDLMGKCRESLILAQHIANERKSFWSMDMNMQPVVCLKSQGDLAKVDSTESSSDRPVTASQDTRFDVADSTFHTSCEEAVPSEMPSMSNGTDGMDVSVTNLNSDQTDEVNSSVNTIQKIVTTPGTPLPVPVDQAAVSSTSAPLQSPTYDVEFQNFMMSPGSQLSVQCTALSSVSESETELAGQLHPDFDMVDDALEEKRNSSCETEDVHQELNDSVMDVEDYHDPNDLSVLALCPESNLRDHRIHVNSSEFTEISQDLTVIQGAASNGFGCSVDESSECRDKSDLSPSLVVNETASTGNTSQPVTDTDESSGQMVTGKMIPSLLDLSIPDVSSGLHLQWLDKCKAVGFMKACMEVMSMFPSHCQHMPNRMNDLVKEVMQSQIARDPVSGLSEQQIKNQLEEAEMDCSDHKLHQPLSVNQLKLELKILMLNKHLKNNTDVDFYPSSTMKVDSGCELFYVLLQYFSSCLTRYGCHKSQLLFVVPEKLCLPSEHDKFVSNDGTVLLFLRSHLLTLEDWTRLSILLIEIKRLQQVEQPSTEDIVALGWLYCERQTLLQKICCPDISVQKSVIDMYEHILAVYRCARKTLTDMDAETLKGKSHTSKFIRARKTLAVGAETLKIRTERVSKYVERTISSLKNHISLLYGAKMQKDGKWYLKPKSLKVGPNRRGGAHKRTAPDRVELNHSSSVLDKTDRSIREKKDVTVSATELLPKSKVAKTGPENSKSKSGLAGYRVPKVTSAQASRSSVDERTVSKCAWPMAEIKKSTSVWQKSPDRELLTRRFSGSDDGEHRITENGTVIKRVGGRSRQFSGSDDCCRPVPQNSACATRPIEGKIRRLSDNCDSQAGQRRVTDEGARKSSGSERRPNGGVQTDDGATGLLRAQDRSLSESPNGHTRISGRTTFKFVQKHRSSIRNLTAEENSLVAKETPANNIKVCVTYSKACTDPRGRSVCRQTSDPKGIDHVKSSTINASPTNANQPVVSSDSAAVSADDEIDETSRRRRILDEINNSLQRKKDELQPLEQQLQQPPSTAGCPSSSVNQIPVLVSPRKLPSEPQTFREKAQKMMSESRPKCLIAPANTNWSWTARHSADDTSSIPFAASNPALDKFANRIHDK